MFSRFWIIFTIIILNYFSGVSISISSVTQSCPTLCDPMNCSMSGFPIHHQLPVSIKPMSIVSVVSSNHLILCGPLLFLPSIFPSIWVFSNEKDLCIRWPKYWSFSIGLYNEYSRLISFRIDWFGLFAVQVAFKNLLYNHSLRASIL